MLQTTDDSKTVVYRNRLADVGDKYLFLVLFAVGTAAIIILKRSGFSQFVVTAAPFFIMVVYAGYVMYTPRYRLRDDRAGDSLYYLGFLFTMVSLAYSLYEFSSVEGGTRSIVTNFGIALATTIVGLAGRVLYHQMRQHPFDIEREVHLDLSEAAERLRGEILEALTVFGNLRIATVQSLNEATAGTKVAVEEVNQHLRTAYTTSSAEFARVVIEIATEIRKHTDTVLASLDQQKDHYVREVNAMAKALAGTATILTEHGREIEGRCEQILRAYVRLVERIDAIQVPQDILKGKLEAMGQQLDKFCNAFERLTSRIDEISVPPDLVSEKIEAILVEFDTAIKTTFQKMQLEQERVGLLERLIERTCGLTDELANDIGLLRKESEVQRETIRAAMQILTEAVQAGKEGVSTAVSIFNRSLNEQRVLLQTIEKDVASTLDTVKQHRQRIAADVQTSSDLLSQLHGSLVGLTRTIVEKLDGK
ncbi:MAG TPA: hypothetical protein V6D17_23485 [Candidatus Obscuribacterales bacterium]